LKTGIKINRIFSAHFAVVILLMSLLFFGKAFSKVPLTSQLYLYDFLLLLVCGFALTGLRRKIQLPTLLIPLGLSIFYLGVSIVKFYQTEYFVFVFRHYAIFIYLIVSFILANQFFVSKERVLTSINFIILFSKISLLVQILFLIYSFSTGYTNNDIIQGHRYISPIAILGVITFGAYVIAYSKTLITKIILLIITLLIVLSFGHASAFLSLFLVLFFDLFLRISTRQKIIGLVLVLIITLFLLVFPQFRDGNASWRLMYWGHIIKNVFIENFGFLGNGFGEPYSSKEFAIYVNEEFNSQVLENSYNPYSRWLVGPHNSFLTIMFHIGFVPFLILFSPLKKMVSVIFSFQEINKNLKFLMLSFIGLSVWVAFNVILELPHSSLYFWLLFFTICYFFKYNFNYEK